MARTAARRARPSRWSGTSASDPDAGDPLTYAWTYAAGVGVDAGATCAFSDAANLKPTITCTDDGTFVATLTVDDGVNDPVSDSADVVVANVDPEVDITTPSEGALYALGAVTNLTARSPMPAPTTRTRAASTGMTARRGPAP